MGLRHRQPVSGAEGDMDGDGIATAAEFGAQGRGGERPPTTPPVTPPMPTPPNGRYDRDGDRLIEISNLEQLNAIRYDGAIGFTGSPLTIDGDGVPVGDEATAAYSEASSPGKGKASALSAAAVTSWPVPWTSAVRAATPRAQSTQSGLPARAGNPSTVIS